jgi:hypothetical protein
MRALLIMVVFCTGCTISHTEGEMPEVEFPEFEQVCTENFKVRTKGGGAVLECRIKLKGTFIL